MLIAAKLSPHLKEGRGALFPVVWVGIVSSSLGVEEGALHLFFWALTISSTFSL